MPYKTKAPAPAPPTPTFKTPMKVPKKKNSASDLSMVAAFDDLMRNGSIFQDGIAERQFLVFVKHAGEWQKRWQRAEAERQRLNMLLNDREKELSVKDQKIKQAREMVNIEMRERQRVEGEKENLQRQWHALQDLVNADSVKINNETLEKIRNNYSPAMKKVQRTPSAKRSYLTDMGPLVEQEQESLMDASELSFDDSRDDMLDGSRLRNNGQVYKRRSSNQRQSRSRARRSHSMAGDKIITTTTVTVDQNGHTHAKAILESQAATFGELQEKVKKYFFDRYLKKLLKLDF